MKERNFRMTDAFELMQWLSVMHPEIFKQWVAVKDVERSVEDDYEEVESDGL